MLAMDASIRARAHARCVSMLRGSPMGWPDAGRIGPFAPAPGVDAWAVFASAHSASSGHVGRRDRSPARSTAPPETIEIGREHWHDHDHDRRSSRPSRGSRLSVDITMKTKGQVVADRGDGRRAVRHRQHRHAATSTSTSVRMTRAAAAAGERQADVERDLRAGRRRRQQRRGASPAEFSGAATITVGDDATIIRVEGTQHGARRTPRAGVSPARRRRGGVRPHRLGP